MSNVAGQIIRTNQDPSYTYGGLEAGDPNPGRAADLEHVLERINAITGELELGCDACASNCCEAPDRLIPVDRIMQEMIPGDIMESRTEIIGGEPVQLTVVRTTEHGCSALEDGSCRIYEDRPVYCRVFPFEVVGVANVGMYGSRRMNGLAVRLQECASLHSELSAERKAEMVAEMAQLVGQIPGYLEMIAAVMKGEPGMIYEKSLPITFDRRQEDRDFNAGILRVVFRPERTSDYSGGHHIEDAARPLHRDLRAYFGERNAYEFFGMHFSMLERMQISDNGDTITIEYRLPRGIISANRLIDRSVADGKADEQLVELSRSMGDGLGRQHAEQQYSIDGRYCTPGSAEFTSRNAFMAGTPRLYIPGMSEEMPVTLSFATFPVSELERAGTASMQSIRPAVQAFIDAYLARNDNLSSDYQIIQQLRTYGLRLGK
ncbi:MAG: YkgJ family cysteine cluster protein [archaeon]